jgi:hypothetical protein
VTVTDVADDTATVVMDTTRARFHAAAGDLDVVPVRVVDS